MSSLVLSLSISSSAFYRFDRRYRHRFFRRYVVGTTDGTDGNVFVGIVVFFAVVTVGIAIDFAVVTVVDFAVGTVIGSYAGIAVVGIVIVSIASLLPILRSIHIAI